MAVHDSIDNIDSGQVKLESFKDKTLTTTTLIVDPYYKDIELHGINFRDAKKIKEVANKTNTVFIIFKEISLGIAMAFFGAALGKLISGICWENPIDIIYFFISIILFLISIGIYIIMCTKSIYDKKKLCETLDDFLFKPLGLLEECDNEK